MMFGFERETVNLLFMRRENVIIGICDDDECMREYEKRICRELLQKNFIQGELLLFASGEEMLGCETHIDILLLDIRLRGIDGISMKNLLQKGKNSPYIIFVTGYDDRMQQAFGNRVLGFVRKSDMEAELAGVFQTALYFIGCDIVIEGKYHSREIYAIQAQKEYAKLYFQNGENVSIRMSLVKLEKMLREALFIRTHRSWLINFGYVETLEKDQLVVSGKVIPISVRFQKRVRDTYFTYLREKVRN